MKELEYLISIPKYKSIINDIINKDYNNIYLGNSSANISKMLAILSFNQTNKTSIYVCENIFEATQAFSTLNEFNEDKVVFYPVEEIISSELVASSPAFRLARIEVINRIINNEKLFIVTTPEGLTHLIMSKERLSKSIINVKTGTEYGLRKLQNDLIIRGYKKVSVSDNEGTFSVRGSIIDVFPINYHKLYRINFFDEIIESIKEVDIETQRSIAHLDKILVYPMYEIFYSIEESQKIIEKIKAQNPFCERLSGYLDRIICFEGLDQMQLFTPFIDENCTNLLNLCDNPYLFFDNPNSIIEHFDNTKKDINEYSKTIGISLDDRFNQSIIDIINNNKSIFLSRNIISLNDVKLNKLIDVKTINLFNYNNNLKVLTADINANLNNKTYIITHFDESKLELIKLVLDNANIPYNYSNKILNNKVNLLVDNAAIGFNDYDLNLIVITPNEYLGNKLTKNNKFAKYYEKSTKIYNQEEIKAGDYVIHQNYGVGIYRGVETKEVNGHLIDFLYIQYDENSKLFVPVENIYQIEKYNVSSDSLPKLDNLHSNAWNKKKAQAKNRIEEIAEKLIKIQAARLLKEGFIYNKDTKEQLEFEKDFEYVETPDQLKAINDVKQDMESNHPMDRLICGDVGFGKTEVAMRAAFKATLSSKQVAYLAPTTVLSRQHFYTFKERFEKYGVRVELLNRFVSKKDQEIVLKGLEEGYVDIVIGTHRILSNDLKFKNLGLLIIDEEQRFGVKHKERIKELKENIDVLTLTATPIPRTLQMSLSGLKDLSIIGTPPINRLPIQTYVLESNDSVLREAINKELARGGQVFYLLNRIDELQQLVNKVHDLCPQAKIGVIHGQMDKDDIEQELVGFLEEKYNVLICTTIIETGIDIPNANTIVIEKAYLLGLSQLYQIRGRVGRSERLAYAYLMYEKGKILTQDAISRLDAIKEFTELGSGYKIALKDLSIRGAGDILGKEQSGFIDSIGIELYSSMLNSAIDSLKGVIKKEEEQIHYFISIDKHIDDKLVSDDDVKISIHKEINKIKSREELNNLIEEYTDRFGELDNSIKLYMEEKYLEFLLKSHGIKDYNEQEKEVIITFDEDTTKKLRFNEIEELDKMLKPNFNYKLDYRRFIIIINRSLYSDSYIYTLTKFLERVILH